MNLNELHTTDELLDKISVWALQKGITVKGDVKTQYVKLQEEAGELARAIVKNDKAEFIDAIGDCVVVLANLAQLGNKLFGSVPNEHDVNAVCPTCNGDEGYYEDVAGDGGSKMFIGCEDCEPITLNLCLNAAWNIIKDRTGKMKDGNFVKDE